MQVRSKTAGGATESTPVKSLVLKDATSDKLRPTRLLCCDIAVTAQVAAAWLRLAGWGC